MEPHEPLNQNIINKPEEDLDEIFKINQKKAFDFMTDYGKNKKGQELLNDYLGFLKKVRENPSGSSMEEAQEKINQLVSSGVFPMRTIPNEAWEEIKKRGLMLALPSDEVGNPEILAGTIGIDPFIGTSDGERVLVEIECGPDDIVPRPAGRKKIFQGTVCFSGKYKSQIPMDKIRVIGKVNKDGKYGEMEIYGNGK